MPKMLFTDSAKTTMSGSLPQGGTTLVVTSGGGNKFPSPTGGDWAEITLYQKDVGGNEINIEVVKLTARTADTLTIVRDINNLTGFAGGYAYPGSAGTVYVELRMTANVANAMTQKQMNLSDLSSVSTARTNLGLGGAAILSVGTAAGTVAAGDHAHATLAPLASPALTGTPTAPTAAAATNTTQLATTAFVFAERSNAATLTNKTIALGSNTVSGTIAQFNTAVTDADLATLAGAETLTNKTLSLGSNTISGTLAQFNTAVTDADLASLAGTETLTNKTLNLSNNTVSGAKAQFDTACSDDNFAYLATAQNFTAPQRSAILTDNDGSFDLSSKQNFKCTTAAALTLTFTNQQDGLSGAVIFINSSNHTVSAHANTKLSATDLAKLSVTGTYRVDYLSDGTNAYCSVTGAFA